MAKSQRKNKSPSGKKPKKRSGLGFIAILFIFLLLGCVGYLAFRVNKNPERIYPYTYTLSGSPKQEELQQLNQTQVLMIGDRLALDMNKYADELIKSASANIIEPIKFNIWAQNGLGLHRVLGRLKSLENFPAVVIYYGASEEFYETRTHVLQYQDYLRNKFLYEHEVVSSLLLAWPLLSRVIYWPYHFFNFDLANDPTVGPIVGAGPGKLEQMEMLYQVFEWEMEELVSLIKEKNSKLVIVTPPINLDVPPKANCSLSDDSTIRSKLVAQRDALKAGKSKEAYDELKIIAEQTVANAHAFYLYGQAANQLGRTSEAKKALTKAATVDCATWRASPIFNAIIRKTAQKHSLNLVDYDQQLNAMYGQNVLFFDPINPQNVYNRAMMTKLGELIARLMNL